MTTLEEVVNMRPVLVCTEKRGVIFGYVPKDVTNLQIHESESQVYLRARMCVIWSEATQGVFGLAETGPGENCRIGPAADIVDGPVHCVLDVTAEAAKLWESQPWAQ